MELPHGMKQWDEEYKATTSCYLGSKNCRVDALSVNRSRVWGFFSNKAPCRVTEAATAEINVSNSSTAAGTAAELIQQNEPNTTATNTDNTASATTATITTTTAKTNREASIDSQPKACLRGVENRGGVGPPADIPRRLDDHVL